MSSIGHAGIRSPWLFLRYMYGTMKEVKIELGRMREIFKFYNFRNDSEPDLNSEKVERRKSIK